MNIRRIGIALVGLGLATAGTSVLSTDAAHAGTTGIAMLCTQSPNITGDTNATFQVSFDAPTEVESGTPFSVEDIIVPFTNNQGFNLDIGPGFASFTANDVVPDFVQLNFPKVNVPNGASTDFGPFDLHFGGAAPGEIEVRVEEVRFDVALAGGLKLTEVRCTPTGSDILTEIDVVLPPPPGAPNANPDSAEVKPGESVNIDVLANDEAPELDRVSLGEVSLPEIMDAPSEGTAVVEEDGTITYTADSDTTATGDSFDYRICTEFDVPEAAFGKAFRPRGEQLPCDTTTVSIDIVQPQATTVPPTDAPVTTAGGTGVSPTTDELPVTGSSSTPLGVLGFAIVAMGLGLLAAGRRRHALR
jgi:LPXTG-motif cell wall-anchored protein